MRVIMRPVPSDGTTQSAHARREIPFMRQYTEAEKERAQKSTVGDETALVHLDHVEQIVEAIEVGEHVKQTGTGHGGYRRPHIERAHLVAVHAVALAQAEDYVPPHDEGKAEHHAVAIDGQTDAAQEERYTKEYRAHGR